MMKKNKFKLHFLTIFIIGCSATISAVLARHFLFPLLWLIFLSAWIIVSAPSEFKLFFYRIAQIGSLLLIVSAVQILFRRSGAVILSLNGFPLIFSEGLNEAILLWIRFMIIFMLAYVFSQVSLFEFFIFMNKIGVSLQFSLLLLTTIKFIPFIFDVAKKGLWSVRFRGIRLKQLSIKNKYLVLRKILIPMLFQGVHYASFSSLGLELRGYGVTHRVKIDYRYRLINYDYFVLAGVFVFNLSGLLLH
jgi:energy-coupling factor transporter transmembrane protein EcfT